MELIKSLINSFNKSRIKVNKYKSTISNHYINSRNYFNVKQGPIFESPKNSTALWLAKMYTYCKKEFEVISIRAFLSEHIREILSIWETDHSLPITITEAADNVLSYIKMEYPKLKNWSNQKLEQNITFDLA